MTTLEAKSVPPGLKIVVMDQVTTDKTLQAVIGSDGRINGNTPQILNGTRYDFDHWAFTGAVPGNLNATSAYQNFIVPVDAVGFTAQYRAVPNPVYAFKAVNNQYVPCAAADISAAKWLRTDNGDGTSSSRNQRTNGFLVAEGGGANPLKANRGGIGGWEKFPLSRQTLPGPQFALTLAIASGAGATSPAAGSTMHMFQGGSQAVSATPGAGWLFDHWTATSGMAMANTNTASTTVTNITANGTVTAYFIVDNTPPPTGTRYAIKAVNNQYATLPADTKVQPNSANVAGVNQVFEIGSNGDATVYVRSLGNGNYCQAIGAADITCNAPAVSSNAAMWIRVENADGTISLKNLGTNGHLVSEGGGTAPSGRTEPIYPVGRSSFLLPNRLSPNRGRVVQESDAGCAFPSSGRARPIAALAGYTELSEEKVTRCRTRSRPISSVLATVSSSRARVSDSSH